MARDNRTLGRFDLVGIPPAPRGVPQIEVTFDIDANGIVHVSAKDMGTGKEQKIRIESSSGLSEDEIKRMVRDAETHAEEDRATKEKVEVQNEADSLIYATEKSLKDYGDKVTAEDKKAIESAIAGLRKSLEGNDILAIKGKVEELKQASYKLAEEIYKTQQEQGDAPQGGAETEAQGSEEAEPKKKDDKGNVADVDYEVVDDDK